MEIQMSTETKPPANPMRGNLRGQATLAAKIDRWQNMNSHVQAQLADFPQLKDFQTKFQQVIAEATTLRTEMKAIEADALDATARRNEIIQAGDDLYSRLSHGLRSVLGPKSERLVKYGLKRGKTGPKSKAAGSTPPPVEAKESPAAPGSAEK
jgi:hypothetical protein